MTITKLLPLCCVLLFGCVTNTENFVPAGFASAADARPYVPNYLYYAKKVTIEEWSAFYDRFPAYWTDVQNARRLGSSAEFHPWYSA